MIQTLLKNKYIKKYKVKSGINMHLGRLEKRKAFCKYLSHQTDKNEKSKEIKVDAQDKI